MPILSPALPPQSAEVRPLWEAEESVISQGPEGQLVREQIERVSRHWRQQSSGGILTPSADLLDELSAYRHPAFERVGKRRVRYVRVLALQPGKMIFDEVEE